MHGLERILTIVFYATAATFVGLALWGGGSPATEPSMIRTVGFLGAVIPATLLLVFSLFGLGAYFLFIPSISRDGHLFSRVHAVQLLHPLGAALLLLFLGVCIRLSASILWWTWLVLFVVYLVQTGLIAARMRNEPNDSADPGRKEGFLYLVLNLMLGGELVTLAGGAKPLAPWRLDSLPEDTWVIDVRTKPEFFWNRLKAAESFPWGEGITEAAPDKPKDRPVLVTCFSGHRSPAVAVALRKMGFADVYNLNWGILYLLLLERGKKSDGPFSLTRPHRDPNRRGEDLRPITHGYVALLFLILIGAPMEGVLLERSPGLWHAVVGGVLTAAGFGLGIMSFRSLGRNFRVYAAPRRSGALVTTGVYKWIRHPMYGGIIVGLAGYLLIFGAVFLVPAWIALTALYLVKAIREERILADKFPQYDGYRSQTWRFVPYIM